MTEGPVSANKEVRGLRPWLIAGLAFCCALLLFLSLISTLERLRAQERREAVTEVVKLHAADISNHLDRTLSATFALAAIVRHGNGRVDHFESLAQEMISSYGGIGALQLAPGGTIRQVVPLEGNEVIIGFNPLLDPEQGPGAREAIDRGKFTLVGPFHLKQGGFGVIGRHPVFVTSRRGERSFWGFVQVVVRIDDLLETSSIRQLETAGYRYELSRIEPQSGERVVMARSSPLPLKSSVDVSIVVPDGQWILSVDRTMPDTSRQASFWGLLAALLASLLMAAAVFSQQRESLRLKREIGERLEAEEGLKRSSGLLREIIDTIDSGIILWNRERRLVVWNNAMEELYPNVASRYRHGMARDELREIREAQGEKEVVQQWDELGTWDRRLPDGRIISLRRLAMADGGRLVLHTDVTEARYRKETLARSERMASLGKLVAGVAHEINTPIGNALLVASTVQDQIREMERAIADGAVRRSTLDQFMSTVRDADEMLVRNLSRAAELIQHFKSMAVDQTNEMRRDFSLIAVVEDVTASLQRKIRLARHQLKVDIDPSLRMDSYPGALGQIITNFIENSLLHAFPDREGGAMCLAARDVDARRLEIVFSDDGVGVAPEYLARVFDPFFTTKLGQGGSGLGLSIVMNLARDLLGGEIEISSPDQRGTIIRMVLPKMAPERQAVAEPL